MVGILRSRPIAGKTLSKSPYELEALETFIANAKRLWMELGRVGAAEREGLIATLTGKYIDPSPGGEIVGDWNVLPTGRNMASTGRADAAARGRAAQGKAQHRATPRSAVAKRGKLPEAVGVVLWGSEMLESEGVGIAQALDLLGAKVSKDFFGRAERCELIPLEKLGRPRIDILANTSAVFKNTFPGSIRLVHDAVILAAKADSLTK